MDAMSKKITTMAHHCKGVCYSNEMGHTNTGFQRKPRSCINFSKIAKATISSSASLEKNSVDTMPKNKRINTEKWAALTRRYSYDPLTQNDFGERKESSHHLPELLTSQLDNNKLLDVASTAIAEATRRTNFNEKLRNKHVTESFGNLPFLDCILGNDHSSEQVNSKTAPDDAISQEDITFVSSVTVEPPFLSLAFVEPSVVSPPIYEPPFEIYSFKTTKGNDSTSKQFSYTSKPKHTSSFIPSKILSNNLHQHSSNLKSNGSFNRDLQHVFQNKTCDQNNISNKFDANDLAIAKNSFNPIDQNRSHGLSERETTTFRSHKIYEKHDVYCTKIDNEREKMLDVVGCLAEDVADKGAIRGSFQSLIKEELSLKIQCRRLSRGEPELKICPQQPKKYELTQDEIKKNVIRLHQNRQASAKARRLLRKREKKAKKAIQDESQTYARHLAEIATLKEQRDALKAVMRAHKDSYFACKVP